MSRTCFIVLLTMVAVCLILAGCGGAAKPLPSPTPSPTAAQTPSPAVSPTFTPASTPVATPLPTSTATPPRTPLPTPAPGDTLAQIMGKGTDIGPVRYDVTITGTGRAAPQTMTVWLKGAWTTRMKMRQEMTSESEPTVLLVDYATRTMYTYYPAQSLAMRADFSGAPELPMRGAGQIRPVYVGADTVDGKTCDIYEWTYEGASVKAWLWMEHRLPVKLVSTTPAGVTTVEYKNMEFGDIPDDTFRLPPDTIVGKLSS